MCSIDYKLAEESNFLDDISGATFDLGKQSSTDMAAPRGGLWQWWLLRAVIFGVDECTLRNQILIQIFKWARIDPNENDLRK